EDAAVELWSLKVSGAKPSLSGTEQANHRFAGIMRLVLVHSFGFHGFCELNCSLRQARFHFVSDGAVMAFVLLLFPSRETFGVIRCAARSGGRFEPRAGLECSWRLAR